MCGPAQSLQLRPTLCNPVDCSPPGSSVHEILQSRILEWVSMPSSRGSSQPRGSHPCLLWLLHCRWILYHWPTRGALQCVKGLAPLIETLIFCHIIFSSFQWLPIAFDSSPNGSALNLRPSLACHAPNIFNLILYYSSICFIPARLRLKAPPQTFQTEF